MHLNERHRRTKAARLLAAAALAAFAGCGPAGGERRGAAPEAPLDSATIVFTARRGGVMDLFLLRGLAAEPRRLGSGAGGRNAPSVSPDGRRVAFQSRAEGNLDIAVADLSGGGPVNLTRHPDHDVLPVWSPDGRRIAFMSNRGFELGGIGPFPGHVYVMDADGSGVRQVTREPLTSSLGPQDWSPDGRHLLISRVVGERPDLYLLEVETGAETRLTSDPAGEYGASFSPDGARIAFHAEMPESSQIVVMLADGRGRETLTAGPGRRYSPAWSPDGAWLVFDAEGAGGEQYDIRAVHVRDRREVAIVATSEDEREASWVPRAR